MAYSIEIHIFLCIILFMRKGFTLVELSIVLVIIGLLIGGILVAQSMINTAKINATVQQISQFDAGTMSFKARFNYLPGDAPAYGGDGDGLITGMWGAQVNVYRCEMVWYWNHINPDEYASETCDFNGTKATISGAGKNVPASKGGKPGSWFLATAISDASARNADPNNPANYYVIVDGDQAQTPSIWSAYQFRPTTSDTATFSPPDLLALDKKMDDGAADAGNVIAGTFVDDSGGWGAVTNIERTECSSNADYNLTNTGYECTPLIRIGGYAESPQ